MKDHQEIVEKLSQFNNLCFTKKQWDIILKGCGCPKSAHFWTALRNLCMWYSNKQYYLSDIDSNTMEQVFKSYSEMNCLYAKKSFQKAKAKAKIEEWRKNYKPTTLYLVSGVVTTEKPEYNI